MHLSWCEQCILFFYIPDVFICLLLLTDFFCLVLNSLRWPTAYLLSLGPKDWFMILTQRQQHSFGHSISQLRSAFWFSKCQAGDPLLFPIAAKGILESPQEDT